MAPCFQEVVEIRSDRRVVFDDQYTHGGSRRTIAGLLPRWIPGADALPAAVDQPLHGLELDLVRHFAALRDPIAEVEKRQLQAAAPLDLPQNVVRAVACTAHIRIEKRVYRRQAVL